MKSIKELREQYQVITEKEDKEQRKLTALVRAGLFDAKKLPMLKRALEKGVDKMTPAEKKILIDLLDSLMNQVISNEPIYMKVKRNVQSMDEEIIAEAVKTPVAIADVPSIVVLKRKAVRVYPGGQQVGLYYSQQLDKYVTIPFGEAGISEEVDLEEARRDRYYDVDDFRNTQAERTPYERMTSDQRKRTTPFRVAGRSIAAGETARETIAKTLFALMQGRRVKSSRLKQLKQIKASPEHKKKIANKAAQIVQQRIAKATANAANAAPKQSAATSGTMQNRVRQVAKQKTISEKAALKEAVLLKLIERHQLDEVAFLAPVGAVAGAALRAAGPYVARGLAAAGPTIGRMAGGAGRLLSRGKRKLGALSRLGRMRRRRKKDFDLDLDYNDNRRDTGRGSSGSSTPIFDRSKFAKDVTYTQRQFKDTPVVGAQWDQGSDAFVDRATARRDRNKFYSQPQQQNESVEVNLDGNIVEINSNIAEKLVNVYEALNDNNKQKMVDMLMNEETQSKILEFVTRY